MLLPQMITMRPSFLTGADDVLTTCRDGADAARIQELRVKEEQDSEVVRASASETVKHVNPKPVNTRPPVDLKPQTELALALWRALGSPKHYSDLSEWEEILQPLLSTSSTSPNSSKQRSGP